MRNLVIAAAVITIILTVLAFESLPTHVDSHNRYMKISRAIASDTMSLREAYYINEKLSVDCILADKYEMKDISDMSDDYKWCMVSMESSKTWQRELGIDTGIGL